MHGRARRGGSVPTRTVYINYTPAIELSTIFRVIFTIFREGNFSDRLLKNLLRHYAKWVLSVSLVGTFNSQQGVGAFSGYCEISRFFVFVDVDTSIQK